jgi:radical SAM superfamily enzyme YgiQ (UPF0313 family)
MKFLLINPSQSATYGKASAPSYPPLGLSYIGAVLEQDGHQVHILDFDADRMNEEKIINFLKNFKPSLVGLTATTPTYDHAVSIAKLVKSVDNIPVVLGGIHATITPQTCISNKFIDFVIKGEGEITTRELIRAIENNNNFSNIDGLFYKNNGEIIQNKERCLIENLDDLPFPARHLFNQQKYTYPDALYSPVFPIITSRGCPGACTYCCTKLIFGRMFRFRSPKNIVDEIEFLVEKYKAKEIHIWDDNFTLIKKRVFEFCDEIKKRNIDLAFSLPNGIRVDQVNYEVLSSLKKIGLYSAAFGVESGSQKILNNVKKGTKINQIRGAFKLCKKLKIETWAFFMLGLPGDTIKTIKQTIEFAKELDPDVAKFHILKPFPGTEVFDLLSRQGLIIESDWTRYGIHTKPVHKLLDMNEDELMILLREAYRQFYLNPSKIIKEILRMKSYTRVKLNLEAGLSILKMIK